MEFLDIQATIESGFTLKRVRDMARTYSMNFILNWKVRNYFTKVFEHLVITEYFQPNDHVFLNIHHCSVLRSLDFDNEYIDRVHPLHVHTNPLSSFTFKVGQNFVHQVQIQIDIMQFYTAYLIICYN